MASARPAPASKVGAWAARCTLVTAAAAADHLMGQQVGRRGADDVPRALATRAAHQLSHGVTPQAVAGTSRVDLVHDDSAVVTMALCGSLTHPGPCPLAPHHTATRCEGDRLLVRVVFAAELQDEPTVRERIIAALESDRTATPQDVTTGWQVLEYHTVNLTGDERDRVAQR